MKMSWDAEHGACDRALAERGKIIASLTKELEAEKRRRRKAEKALRELMDPASLRKRAAPVSRKAGES